MEEKPKGKKRFQLEILRIALIENYNQTPTNIRDALKLLLFSFDEMVDEEIKERKNKIL